MLRRLPRARSTVSLMKAFAGQLRQRRVEVAAAELCHHAHCQLLDRDMRTHHFVDAGGHAAEVTVEARGIDHHIDVAGFVFGRHVVDLADQAGEVAAQLIDGLVDGSASCPAAAAVVR